MEANIESQTVQDPIPVTKRTLDDGDYIIVKWTPFSAHYYEIAQAKRLAEDILGALDLPTIPNPITLPLLERLKADRPTEKWALKRDDAIVMAMVRLSYRDITGAHKELSRASYFDGRSVEAGEEGDCTQTNAPVEAK